ncbi:MAG: chromate efflux transporter [Pseudomonadota bacterium]
MIGWGELTRVFGRIGILSFGGPAAQIALMHKELVEERDWLTEDQYLRALSFCMLLPGPEAMQLATYAGWRQRGILGGLIGGGLFVLPGAIVIMALALLYGAYGNLNFVQALFLGVKATVVVIVIEALLKVAKRALTSFKARLIALAAFVALFFFALPFPLVIAVAALVGAYGAAGRGAGADPIRLPWQNSLTVLAVGSMIWAAPILLLQSAHPILTDIAAFFAWLAVVTFGGAYAVLAYMTQAVVGEFGWLTTPQMMDALGLAETTPGPLILVTQFVGMVAAAEVGGTQLAIAAGAVTLWVTFVPCFIWIFAGAPLIDWLADQPRLKAALAGITAAVVGVIANLSLWFAMHVFFRDVTVIEAGPLRLSLPNLTSLDLTAIILAGVAGTLLLWRKLNIIFVLLISVALSGAIGAVT